MIDPKQLRIGNYLFDKDWDAERPIGATDIYNIVIKGSDNYDPISLTPEWLDKVGEKYSREDKSWEYQINVGALKWYFRWNTEWYSELGGIYLDSRIKYMHQLQNLYFTLTNKELELKNNN